MLPPSKTRHELGHLARQFPYVLRLIQVQDKDLHGNILLWMQCFSVDLEFIHQLGYLGASREQCSGPLEEWDIKKVRLWLRDTLSEFYEAFLSNDVLEAIQQKEVANHQPAAVDTEASSACGLREGSQEYPYRDGCICELADTSAQPEAIYADAIVLSPISYFPDSTVAELPADSIHAQGVPMKCGVMLCDEDIAGEHPVFMCIEELKPKATIYQKTNLLPVYEYTATIRLRIQETSATDRSRRTCANTAGHTRTALARPARNDEPRRDSDDNAPSKKPHQWREPNKTVNASLRKEDDSSEARHIPHSGPDDEYDKEQERDPNHISENEVQHYDLLWLCKTDPVVAREPSLDLKLNLYAEDVKSM
ncbi:hypothetical protein KAF25_002005 [Fusarium avenaceum]|uniref:Uncharacterized protein n=1 Tax=Fusarium avenaceum TaxID=40199 RepID=A0A9P7KUH5_9HYPO|nr:hypothetical protein KAF25_002005 [Fusarium avenaceum]